MSLLLSPDLDWLLISTHRAERKLVTQHQAELRAAEGELDAVSGIILVAPHDD